MTLDEAVTYLREALDQVDPTVHTEFRMSPQEVEQLLEWLEEYHKIKEYWLPSGEEELRKERGECNNLYDKIDIVVNGLYSAIADQIIEKIGLANKYKQLEADYIDIDNRLRTANAEIDRLQSESSWIPCSVKKPEAYKSVLVVIKDNGYTWINIGETDEDGNWMIGGEFWYSKSDTSITHWMPTPELPKEVTP